MGDLYILAALEDAELRESFRAMDLALPPDVVSRWPGLREVMDAAAAFGPLRQWTSEAADSLDLAIGKAATLWLKSKAGGETRIPSRDDEPVDVTFHKGDPALAIRITERLSRVCGPLVLIEANDARLLLVTPGIDPDAALAAWLGTPR